MPVGYMLGFAPLASLIWRRREHHRILSQNFMTDAIQRTVLDFLGLMVGCVAQWWNAGL